MDDYLRLRRTLTQPLIALLLVSLTCGAAAANTTASPVALLEDMRGRLFVIVNQQREQLKNNPQQVQHIMEENIVPHIDFVSASRWVLGKHWRKASREQKLQFMREFRSLFLHFYSTALAEYLAAYDERHAGELLDKDMIVFKPLRARSGATDVVVRSELHKVSSQPIAIHYHMHQRKNGWKVYDVSINGISVVSTYRSNFSREIRTGGLDGLITSLNARNQQYAVKPSIQK